MDNDAQSQFQQSGSYKKLLTWRCPRTLIVLNRRPTGGILVVAPPRRTLVAHCEGLWEGDSSGCTTIPDGQWERIVVLERSPVDPRIFHFGAEWR
jgi:hypothetical protein